MELPQDVSAFTTLIHSLFHQQAEPGWLSQRSSPGPPNLRSRGYFFCRRACWQLSHNPTTEIRRIGFPVLFMLLHPLRACHPFDKRWLPLVILLYQKKWLHQMKRQK